MKKSDNWTVREHRFQNLVAARPQTAAEHVPLVMWFDVIEQRDSSFANRHVDFLSLYIVQRGRGTHVIDGFRYGVSRGDVYAMGLGMTHHFEDGDDLVLDTLHFSPGVFDTTTRDALMQTRGFQSLFVEEPYRRAGLAEANPGARWLHLTPDAYAEVAIQIAELRREWASGTPSGVLLTRGLFVRLLVHLARRYAQGEEAETRASLPSSEAHEATVAAAVRYLDAHFHEPLRIEQVAASVFLSPDRFTEVFVRVMGRTPRDYLRYIRLERAKLLLQTTGLSVSEVGAQSGWGEAAYFTRAFRAATGTTPSRYRKP